MKLFEFPIMREGDYGDKGLWDRKRLARIADNYSKRNMKAPLVLGHPKHDDPAHGWVEDLFLRGGELWAKAGQVSKDLVEMVKDGRYGPVSAKIGVYKDLRGFGEELRHVGFQGAIPPVIKGMQQVQFAEGDFILLGEQFTELTDDEDSDIKNRDDNKNSKENPMGDTVSLDNESKSLLQGLTESITGLFKKTTEETVETTLSEAEKENKELKEKLSKFETQAEERDKDAAKQKATAFAEKCVSEKKILPVQRSTYVEVAMGKSEDDLDKLFSELPTMPEEMFKQKSKSQGNSDAKVTVDDAFTKLHKDGEFEKTKNYLMSELGLESDEAERRIKAEFVSEFSEEDAQKVLD